MSIALDYPDTDYKVKYSIENTTKLSLRLPRPRNPSPIYSNEIYKLINLEDLSLTEIAIDKIPPEISNLVKLQKIYIIYSNLVELPKEICTLTSLKRLVINSNKIKKIDSNICKLYNLEDIGLSYNQIVELPKEIWSLTKLNILYMSNNMISNLGLSEVDDKMIQLLCKSVNLHLSDNEIINIDKNLFKLTNLRLLNLARNDIVEVCHDISKLSDLYDFDIMVNRIVDIGEGIFKLTNLGRLSLEYNYIETISDNISLLENLTNLYIGENQIKKLPQSLIKLKQLKSFGYNGNPIEYIPPNVSRWLMKFHNYTDGTIYNDTQSVHNHHIQSTFKQSVQKLLDTKPVIQYEEIFIQLTNLNHLELIQLIESNCLNDSVHSELNITFKELLIAVFQRILIHKDKDEILKILLLELNDAQNKCFTGRLTRLINCLSGFDEDVELQISENDQIGNVLSQLRKVNPDDSTFKQIAFKQLHELGYSDSTIEEWLV